MSDALVQTTLIQPNQIALIYGAEQWTYAELRDAVAEYAGKLAALGVGSGYHVAALLSNQPEYVFLVHALARLNAVLIPLNTRLTPGEIGWQVEKARCETVICSGETYEQVAPLIGQRRIISVDSVDNADVIALADVVAEPEIQVALPSPDTITAIVFTSGTTGHPKGAQLSWGNFESSAKASRQAVDQLQPGDRWLLTLPLYHVGGLSILWRCCLAGATVVLQPRFDLDAVNEAINEGQITHLSLVPTMLKRLLDLRGNAPAPESLRLLLLGGAAAPAELLERAFKLGYPAAPTYGLTEACSQVATMLPDSARKKPGSVGQPLSGTTVRIASNSGVTLPPREYGEIVISGATVMCGYFDEAGNQTLRDGDLYTGDIGFLDEDGDLWLVQRRSDLIVSGGENIYPAEIEAVLRKHPAIVDVSVVGIPSEEWGQQVAATIVPADHVVLTEESVISFCRQHLAGYKIPRKINFVSQLPQTASGKIQVSMIKSWLMD